MSVQQIQHQKALDDASDVRNRVDSTNDLRRQKTLGFAAW